MCILGFLVSGRVEGTPGRGVTWGGTLLFDILALAGPCALCDFAGEECQLGMVSCGARASVAERGAWGSTQRGRTNSAMLPLVKRPYDDRSLSCVSSTAGLASLLKIWGAVRRAQASGGERVPTPMYTTFMAAVVGGVVCGERVRVAESGAEGVVCVCGCAGRGYVRVPGRRRDARRWAVSPRLAKPRYSWGWGR